MSRVVTNEEKTYVNLHRTVPLISQAIGRGMGMTSSTLLRSGVFARI